MEKEKAATSKAKSCTNKPTKPVPDSSRSAKASTDSRFAELDQKWSDRFNRLEALLLTTNLDKEPTIQTVRVAPTHSPLVSGIASIFMVDYSSIFPTDDRPIIDFLCQLTCQSADIMSSLCGVGVRVRVNNFFSKTTRPRDMLFFLKDTLSIED